MASSACFAQNNTESKDAGKEASVPAASAEGTISLPAPDHLEKMSLDQALQDRRSNRQYANTSLSVQQVSDLLWAAQGITEASSGKRTAPSGLQIYPLTFHLAVSNVEGLPEGLYAYHAPDHTLIRESGAEQKAALLKAFGQNGQNAPLVIAITGNYTPYQKFGTDMANQSIYLEAGHAAQNFLLEVTACNLSGVPFSGFNPESAGEALQLQPNEKVVYGIACGNPA